MPFSKFFTASVFRGTTDWHGNGATGSISGAGLVAIDLSSEDEYAISRPSVIKESGVWKMWYSYRGDAYRIGYAESLDGRAWIRKDEYSGIETSKTGWDSEMIEYPFVFRHDGELYMLYNGNNYGESGFGLAIYQ